MKTPEQALSKLLAADPDDWPSAVAKSSDDELLSIFDAVIAEQRLSAKALRLLLEIVAAKRVRFPEETLELLYHRLWDTALQENGEEAVFSLRIARLLASQYPALLSSALLQMPLFFHLADADIAGVTKPLVARRHFKWLLHDAKHRQIDWGELLDLRQAANNCADDAKRDWHKDPWASCELDLLQREPSLIRKRIASVHVAPAVRLDVASSADKDRPALIMDLVDRVCFQALADRLAFPFLSALPEWVYGWRTARNSPARGVYAENGSEWVLYGRRLSGLFQNYRFGLRTDIADFFSSVSIGSLIETLSQQQFPSLNHILARTEHYLRSWERIPRRRGLPQRSLGSSVLAQAYLKPIDEFLIRRTKNRTGRLGVCRWMDDIWLFSNRERDLVMLRDELDDLLYARQLEMNTKKTILVRTSKSPVAEFLRTTSTVEKDIQQRQSDQAYAHLDGLIAGFLKTPLETPRSSLGYVSNRIKSLQRFSIVSRIKSHLDEFPQAADYLAELIRKANAWQNLQKWYVDEAHKRFASWDWTVQAWGLMFPRSYPEKGIVAQYFAKDVLTRKMPTTLVPLAAKRVSQWLREPMDVLRTGIDLAKSPFEIRALALAAVDAQGSPQEVRRWLSSHGDLEVTLRYLEERKFQTITDSTFLDDS
jgi:hypothetical protein